MHAEQTLSHAVEKACPPQPWYDVTIGDSENWLLETRILRLLRLQFPRGKGVTCPHSRAIPENCSIHQRLEWEPKGHRQLGSLAPQQLWRPSGLEWHGSVTKHRKLSWESLGLWWGSRVLSGHTARVTVDKAIPVSHTVDTSKSPDASRRECSNTRPLALWETEPVRGMADGRWGMRKIL